MNFFLRVSSALLFSHMTFAFVNIEALRKVPGDGFVGSTGLQFSGQDGNTKKFSSRVNTLGIFRYPRDEFLYTADYRYGSSGNRNDTNRGQGHLRYTFFHQEILAYEVFVQSGFDEFKDLNSRNLLGLNLRIQVLKDQQHALYLGTGVFYEIEDFSLAQDEEGFRGNLYLSHNYVVNEGLSTFVTIYYQPSLEDIDNYRYRMQCGLNVRVTDSVSLNADINFVHDTGLPQDVKPTDTDYMFGLAVKY